MMRLVILESPFAGMSKSPLVRWLQRRANVRYARACVRDSLLRGEAPIASHLLYTQPGVLDDTKPAERQHGIDAGLAWRARAEASVFYVDRGVSRGMEYGMVAAVKAGVQVEIRVIHPAFIHLGPEADCIAKARAVLARVQQKAAA